MFTSKVINKVYPVILSGGSGERLWPLSRKTLPKQFLRLFDERTMFQEVILRANNLDFTEPSMIICNQEHESIVSRLLDESNLKISNLILEPFGRNTAPAIVIAALEILNKDSEGILLVLPSDHMIDDQELLSQKISSSLRVVEDGYIVVFGIEANNANINYGYIKLGERVYSEDNIFKVEEFTEKPNAIRAKEYLKAGNYYWNAGIFLFKASVFIEEMNKHNPRLIEQCKEVLHKSSQKDNLISLEADSFGLCESISIDYALMEKTRRAACAVLQLDWFDVGSWKSMWEISPKDLDGNAIKGEAYVSSSSNNYIHSTSRLVAAVGVEDLVIIETADAVLVAKRDNESEIRNLVQNLLKPA